MTNSWGFYFFTKTNLHNLWIFFKNKLFKFVIIILTNLDETKWKVENAFGSERQKWKKILFKYFPEVPNNVTSQFVSSTFLEASFLFESQESRVWSLGSNFLSLNNSLQKYVGDKLNGVLLFCNYIWIGKKCYNLWFWSQSQTERKDERTDDKSKNFWRWLSFHPLYQKFLSHFAFPRKSWFKVTTHSRIDSRAGLSHLDALHKTSVDFFPCQSHSSRTKERKTLWWYKIKAK